MPSRPRGFAALAVAAILAACNAFTAADETPLPSTPAAEAGPPQDGSGTSADGAPQPGPDGAAPPFCAASAATFCDDFDDPTTFGAKWSHPDVAPVGAASIRLGAGKDGTPGLHVVLDAKSGGPDVHAQLVRELATNGEITVELDLKTPTYPTQTVVAVVVRFFDQDTFAEKPVLAGHRSGRVVLGANSAQDEEVAPRTMSFAESWVHLVLSARLSSGTIHASLTATAPSSEPITLARDYGASIPKATKVFVDVGLYSPQPKGTGEIMIDNVVADAR